MIPKTATEILNKQHYGIVGSHSAVQICRWAKKSICSEGTCYKERFYGIKSHLCCQMTPSVVWCQNKCLHCWRAVELTLGSKISGKIDSPSEIIDGCIEAQKKLLIGFKRGENKNLSKADAEKWKEAQEPMHFAISLSGEPMIYPFIGSIIEELYRRGKTSFLVTNGLMPERILELREKNQLPTQLYISVNSSNENDYNKFHRSSEKDAWEKLNKTLSILPTLKCRTVFRINLVKGFNMNNLCVKEFAELIKKSSSQFVEVKGFMSVGFARKRLGYDRMPWHREVMEFAEKLEKELNSVGEKHKILDEHERSCAVVLGGDGGELRIKKI